MKTFRILVIAMLMLAAMPGLALAGAATLYVDDDGLCGGYTPCYTSIQAAVDDASSGDRVLVYPGTYEEQVVIEGKDLTLISKSRYAAVIQAVPDQMGPIVWVRDADNVTVSGFTIDGAGRGYPGCVSGDDRFFGIFFDNASGTIKKNKVMGIHHPDGYHGCQSGVAIYVLSRDYGMSDVSVEYNTVEDFQKTGIAANAYYDEGTTNAYFKGNKAYGWGPTDEIAQNGIQIGFGATGMIDKSNYVTGVYYSGDYWASSGYLLYDVEGVKLVRSKVVDSQVAVYLTLAPETMIKRMQIRDSEYGAIAYASDNVQFNRNYVLGNDYGIYVWESNGADLTYNRIMQNGTGIAIDTSDDAMAKKNYIKENETGIYLYCATNFQEVRNRFVNNGTDILDDGCPTTLMLTYASATMMVTPVEP